MRRPAPQNPPPAAVKARNSSQRSSRRNHRCSARRKASWSIVPIKNSKASRWARSRNQPQLLPAPPAHRSVSRAAGRDGHPSDSASRRTAGGRSSPSLWKVAASGAERPELLFPGPRRDGADEQLGEDQEWQGRHRRRLGAGQGRGDQAQTHAAEVAEPEHRSDPSPARLPEHLGDAPLDDQPHSRRGLSRAGSGPARPRRRRGVRPWPRGRRPGPTLPGGPARRGDARRPGRGPRW